MPDPDARYLVTPLGPADAPLYLAAVNASRAELAAVFTWAGEGHNDGASLAYAASRPEAWAAGQDYTFATRDPETGAILGIAALNRIDWTNGCANLMFWTESGATGRGVATTGARAVAEFGVKSLGLARIEILTGTENRAAQKVAREIGGKREGILRARIRLGETWEDAALYAVLREGLREDEGD